MRRARIFGLFIPVFLLLSAGVSAQTDSSKKKKVPEHYGHQLRLSFDISKPVINQLQNTRKSYEFALDYYHRNEIYFVLEGGFGSAGYHYPDLSYDTRNSFIRLGFDKTLIKRIGNKDWDMAFFGLRYGLGLIRRDAATYTIGDSVWGTSFASIEPANQTAHWVELTGGIKVELLPDFMVGWNLRGRFLMNETSFRDLKPVYIAGFGRGDKSTILDFNVFVSYDIRWGGKADVKEKEE
jgi:hypothetical protein